MSEELKISGVVITFNEEENIEECLQSMLDVIDEIIVVDSFSTDQTKTIAEKYGVKFIEHAFEGHIEQKNYAISQAKHDWVLSLDADERLSENLQSVIKLLKKDGAKADGYRFNRLNNYCGKWIKHCGWYPDTKIRLWHKQKGQWGGVNPHDTVVMDEGTTVKAIKADILHFTYRRMEDHITQMNKFSTIAAEEDHKKGKRTIVVLHLMIYPFLNFLKNYIIRLGFLDGYAGYLVCKNGAYYRFLKYAKLRNLNRLKG
ncbi:glycosyltransferase family 2 protein [Fulvivirga lutimaris]|uniref:glycosyltransferase family 2 protein n=1 Tax=Fulvivirga lutimaris TaxID=1819566 RepID=UPI0012BB8CE5|nr:glycosyltransferase family 2 protein [Fulvivirga lutimaris]MTI39514.1 glycosyltransferase family 2 protein [Fulvivirga lutimaris]